MRRPSRERVISVVVFFIIMIGLMIIADEVRGETVGHKLAAKYNSGQLGHTRPAWMRHVPPKVERMAKESYYRPQVRDAEQR